MLGRNELCPCGSGKKYKRCCLNKDVVVDRAGRKVGTAQKQYSELYTRIYEYSRQDKFKEEYEKAIDQEKRIYNTEAQKAEKKDLVKRSRFYQSLIDSSILTLYKII